VGVANENQTSKKEVGKMQVAIPSKLQGYLEEAAMHAGVAAEDLALTAIVQAIQQVLAKRQSQAILEAAKDAEEKGR
jgi:hypothetical protein